MKIGDEEYVSPLDLFSIIGIFMYKQSFKTDTTKLLSLAERQFEIAELVASSESGETKQNVLIQICNNSVLKNLLRLPL